MNTRELRARDLNNELYNKIKRLKDVLVLAGMTADEFGDLWDLHDDNDTAVACQLYQTNSPTDEQLATVEDFKRGLDLLARYSNVPDEDRKVMRRLG